MKFEKASIAKFGNNVNGTLDDMSSNELIIIYKGEQNEYYFRHIFRAILSVKNSTCNTFIDRTKDDWYTQTEFLERDLIHNSYDK